MKYSSLHSHRSAGFTIVELLIVVVVIAILATLTFVAFNGVQKNAAIALVKESLTSAATAMKATAVESGSYAAIPSSVTPAKGVGYALTELTPPATSTTSFCMNGTYASYNDVVFHISEGGPPTEGLCGGAIISSTVIGDYNYTAGGGSAQLPSAMSAQGDKYGFALTTNDDWTQLQLKWDPQSGITRYQLEVRTSPTGTWTNRRTTDGASNCTPAASCTGYTHTIASATTALTWTMSLPLSFSQTYQYQLRYQKTDGTYSDWSIATLNPMLGRVMPTVTNFKATPNADWTSMALTWDSLGVFADLPGVKLQVEARTSSTGTWLNKKIIDGAGNCSPATSCAGYSYTIASNVTSLSWTSTIPTAIGQVYEYRIRIASEADTAAFSDWTTITAGPLNGQPVPTISNFTVTNAANWSTVSLNWDALSPSFASLPGVKLQLEMRTSPTGTWVYRSIAEGLGNCSPAPNCSGYTHTIPKTTTALTWTTGFPTAAGQTYEYRVRIASSADTVTFGNWSTASLAR